MLLKNTYVELVKRLRRHIPFQMAIYRLLKLLSVPQSWHQHLQVNGWITIPTKGERFRMFSEGDILENAIFWSRDGRGEDSISFQVWDNIAAISDGTILDIGANTGLFALIAKTARRDATVIAFEPVRRIAEKLLRNIRGNNYSIAVIEKAVSDQNGNATFHDSADPTATTNAYSASLEDSFSVNDHSYQVDVVALDTLIPIDQRISLMKIDVEMHEVSAIRGMLGIIERDKPSLLIEILNESIATDVTILLKPFGYQFFESRKWLGSTHRIGWDPRPDITSITWRACHR